MVKMATLVTMVIFNPTEMEVSFQNVSITLLCLLIYCCCKTGPKLILRSFADIPYIDQNSYSNSNNGGSVDSQDSLWKAPVPTEQVNQHHQQQMSRANYEHQQYVDEYAQYNDNRNNYVTDPYGPIPKPKRRLDLIGKEGYRRINCSHGT